MRINYGITNVQVRPRRDLILPVWAAVAVAILLAVAIFLAARQWESNLCRGLLLVLLLASWLLMLLVRNRRTQRMARQLLQEADRKADLEVQLRASEQRYRLLAENARDIIWTAQVTDLATLPECLGNGPLADMSELSRRWTFTYVSPASERILGYTPQEATALSLPDTILPRCWKSVIDQLRASLTGGPVENGGVLELEELCKDGSIKWCEVQVTMLPDSDGRITSIQGISRDVTARKRAEQALRESEQRFRVAAQCANDLIYERNLITGQIEFFGSSQDSALAELPRLSTLEAWRSRLHPDDHQRVIASAERSLATGDSFYEEYRIISDNGSCMNVIDSATCTKDEHGRVVKVIGAVNNVTEARKAAAELRRTKDALEEVNATLEARVAQRTDELTRANQQLRQAQAELVQSEKMRMLGQLVAGMAHEINTPTGSILNVTADAQEHLEGLLRSGAECIKLSPDRVRWLLDVCYRLLRHKPFASDASMRASRRRIKQELTQLSVANPAQLANIIVRCFASPWQQCEGLLEHLSHEPVVSVLEHLLALKSGADISAASAARISKIVNAMKCYSHQGGDQNLETHVNESIDSTLVILQNRLKKLAMVKTYFADDLPPARCGSDISQVWTNILSNACDALEDTPRPQRGRITIATRLEDSHVVVEIFDDGPPIPQDHLPRIFEPFFTTKPVGKGTGLGLSICGGILHQCGGSLRAVNRDDGVSFEVRLLAATTAHAELAAASQGVAVHD